MSNSVRTLAPLLLALAIAAAENGTPYDLDLAPWPCWGGPCWNGSTKDRGIELIDAKSGEILWEASMPDGATPHTSSSPAVSDDHLVILRMNAPAETKKQTKETRPVCFRISPTGG